MLSPPKANTKLRKSQGDYMVVGLSLAPHKLSGYNVCSSSTPECRKYCLNHCGLGGVYPKIIERRIEKTKMFMEDRQNFLEQLISELDKYKKVAKKNNQKLAARLNVFSDIMWEKICPQLFVTHSDVTFYDYTKHVNRYERFLQGGLPSNYHLTLSRSEKNEVDCLRLLAEYNNATIAVVFHEIPAKRHGHPVHEGDSSDLRFKRSGVVGLKSKGKLKKSNSNFVALTSLTSV